jgi:hypothetical protein
MGASKSSLCAPDIDFRLYRRATWYISLRVSRPLEVKYHKVVGGVGDGSRPCAGNWLASLLGAGEVADVTTGPCKTNILIVQRTRPQNRLTSIPNSALLEQIRLSERSWHLITWNLVCSDNVRAVRDSAEPR